MLLEVIKLYIKIILVLTIAVTIVVIITIAEKNSDFTIPHYVVHILWGMLSMAGGIISARMMFEYFDGQEYRRLPFIYSMVCGIIVSIATALLPIGISISLYGS